MALIDVRQIIRTPPKNMAYNAIFLSDGSPGYSAPLLLSAVSALQIIVSRRSINRVSYG